MIKKMLFASAAAAIAVSPAYAEHLDVDTSLTLDNNIDTSIVTDVDFESDVDLRGDVWIHGDIDVDAAAVAVSDGKQVIDGNMVIFDEPTEEEPDSEVTNRAGPVDVAADGNVGVNTAAGQYNSQANIATIAVATGGEEDLTEEAGGMAQASTTGYQSLTATYYGPEFDDPGQDPYEDDNRALVGDLAGDGNIHVNSAAGAFNSQQNIMTMAVATDASLAQASAGVVQYNSGNMVILNESLNVADAGLISGAGNIHVNAAAGVGNQQHNSLTIAASGAFGGNGTGGPGNGGF